VHTKVIANTIEGRNEKHTHLVNGVLNTIAVALVLGNSHHACGANPQILTVNTVHTGGQK
jgi:hypothetical protein